MHPHFAVSYGMLRKPLVHDATILRIINETKEIPLRFKTPSTILGRNQITVLGKKLEWASLRALL